jgi:glycosyltransferase involved in cell wall biosynthesis
MTGGIEKVCRIMGKALYEASIENETGFQIASMYDNQADAFDNSYFPVENFNGFACHKRAFIKEMVLEGRRSDVVILSHLNLLPVGWLIKKRSPKTKLILLAHGIEIWYPLPRYKRRMLQQCDSILSVSQYTQQQVIGVHEFPQNKCKVLNNCLDPYLHLPVADKKDPGLLKKYGFLSNNFILFTLTRISSKEKYKGYDKVLEAISFLREKYPNLKYLLAGKYDLKEKECLDQLIIKNGLEENVVMPGFIPEEELPDHFSLADAYIMPSKGEGFGIAFIEAMYYGLPVIAGNADGSADALLQGKLGQLTDPSDPNEIAGAISKLIEDPQNFLPNKEVVNTQFGYEGYKDKLTTAIA